MNILYFNLKISVLIGSIFLVFLSSSHAMYEFEGELTDDRIANVTRCTCRYNASQSINNNSTDELGYFKGSWLPSFVCSAGFFILSDLTRYDIPTNTSKSVIWNFCLKPFGLCCMEGCRDGWDRTTTCCGSCIEKTRKCCESCSEYCKCKKKHNKEKASKDIDLSSGVVTAQ